MRGGNRSCVQDQRSYWLEKQSLNILFFVHIVSTCCKSSYIRHKDFLPSVRTSDFIRQKKKKKIFGEKKNDRKINRKNRTFFFVFQIFWVFFFIFLNFFILKKHNKGEKKTVLKMWSQNFEKNPFFGHKFTSTKRVFLKLILHWF